MSNSASISAAKKRRGGMPPPMTGGPGQPGQQMGLPPGLPPNFRQLPPQIQQQLFHQLQQRAAAAAAAATASTQPKSAVAPQQPSMPPAPLQTRNPPGGMNNVNGATINVPGPYTVNPVIHNRAMAEVNGIHIRDLPISASGLPCLPSGAALPPNVLFKLHHDELLNMDAILNEHSNKIQMLSNRVDKAERIQGVSGVSVGVSSNKGEQSNISHDDIINNTDFIAKLLDNILTNTNLSDIINQIEPLQKENESLRSLLNSQQTTLNELSGLVMKLISNGLPSYTNGSDNCEGAGGGGGGGDTEQNEYEESGEDGDNVQADIESSVYNPYITNDENNSHNNNNISNDVVGNDGGNYNEMNYGMSEGGGGVFSVSLDNLEEVQD